MAGNVEQPGRGMNARPEEELEVQERFHAPHTLASWALTRLVRLGPQATALAEAVAVLGTRAELREAASLAELSPADAASAADRLADAHLFDPTRPLDFVHPLVRRCVYDDMEPSLRAAMHAQAAREGVAAHPIATDPAGDRWVVEQLEAAAQRAMAQGAPDAAGAIPRPRAGRPADAGRPRLARGPLDRISFGGGTAARARALALRGLDGGKLLAEQSADGAAFYLAANTLIHIDALDEAIAAYDAAVAEAQRRGSLASPRRRARPPGASWRRWRCGAARRRARSWGSTAARRPARSQPRRSRSHAPGARARASTRWRCGRWPR